MNIIKEIMTDRTESVKFEINDEQTRSRWSELVSQDLDKLISDRRILDYKVICDETVNNPEIIKENGFRGVVIVQDADEQLKEFKAKIN